jgi:Putative beta barrel porin-7 (BBP7)
MRWASKERRKHMKRIRSMRTNILRAFAVTLGFSVCTVAQAQSTYTAPSKWSNFRPISDKGEPIKEAAQAATEVLPAPVVDAPVPPSVAPAPEPIEIKKSAATEIHTPTPIESNGAPCQSAPSVYSQAAAAPWESAQMASCGNSRAPLNPWFGSSNLLFLTLEEGAGRPIASGLGNDFNTSLIDPDASTGFDIMAGRYLDRNQFGFGLGYFLWDPSSESVIRLGAAGTIRPASPAYRDISIDAGSGAEPMYDIVDGSGGYAGATAVRATRDLRFQGIEANLFSFGLMGAQRASYAGCNQGLFGRGVCSGNGGFGGAAGPVCRPSSGRVRVMTSHGFRWFQIEDSLEYAYNIDGVAGYQANDLYENVDIENNLYGYQFGGRLNYCLNSRLSMNIGGKFGLYGNDVEMRHRVGTATTAAYRNGAAADRIDHGSSDTVLATLGELDLGLAYRLSNAWSIQGGYRLMGITGVANAVDSLPTDYSSMAAACRVYADDSYLLHGGYAGLTFNW